VLRRSRLAGVAKDTLKTDSTADIQDPTNCLVHSGSARLTAKPGPVTVSLRFAVARRKPTHYRPFRPGGHFATTGGGRSCKPRRKTRAKAPAALRSTSATGR